MFRPRSELSAWTRYLSLLEQAGEQIQSAAASMPAQERERGLAYLAGLVRAGLHEALSWSDPGAPAFVANPDLASRWGADCSDNLYLWTRIDPNGRYRIYGKRGSAFDFLIEAKQGYMQMGEVRNFATLTAGELELEDDGSFEILLAREQQPGNWLPLEADANYVLNVTSNFYNTNYYYELEMTVVNPPAAETEPNDDPASANDLSVGQTISARIDTGCDVDAFHFELETDTFITLTTPTGGDAAIQLVPCDEAANVLACDDDSRGALLPLIDGCLPPGDYCARVRAFSSAATFEYDIELRGTSDCLATDPPTLSGDRSCRLERRYGLDEVCERPTATIPTGP